MLPDGLNAQVITQLDRSGIEHVFIWVYVFLWLGWPCDGERKSAREREGRIGAGVASVSRAARGDAAVKYK